VGINPGLFAAFKGHHYAGPGNHFCESDCAEGFNGVMWIILTFLFLCSGKCLHLSQLVPEPFTAEDDYTLIHYGIGFTNMVSRPTKGSADLTRREIKQGSQILLVSDDCHFGFSCKLFLMTSLSFRTTEPGNGLYCRVNICMLLHIISLVEGVETS